MSIDFNAGCYLVEQKKKTELINNIYQIFANHGFEYRAGRGYAESFEAQLQRISKKEDDYLWVKDKDKSILLGLFQLHQSDNNLDTLNNVWVFSISFNYAYITSDDQSKNQSFLERIIEILEEIYDLTKTDLMWAGYPEDMPNLEMYRIGVIQDLFWFNIFGPKFVDSIGREKLLNAPGWKIKELINGSVVVRLSEHPHVYNKIVDVYLHEYLGLEYIS